MAARILDGKAIAKSVRDGIRVKIEAMRADGMRAPGLAVVMVGSDPASAIYVRNKRAACQEAGMHSVAHDLPEDTHEMELLRLIEALNGDTEIDGILVQLPVPKHISAEKVIRTIAVAKDVDGFQPENLGLLAQRRPRLRPCTPYGVMKMLAHAGIEVRGMDAIIVGQSNIVGRPMMLELLMQAATTTICHSATRDLAAHVRRADILVAAIGKAELIRGDWIKDGAVVIDVGMNRLPSGKLVGDVEFATASQRASWITPVPGGVGPMTIAMLMQNTLESAQRRLGVVTSAASGAA
ncbi:MAG: bifunctional methylenetetrahydrofolate dehydrogenase/methenyltetrahydrofolate cyclohydrolase FolD [Steroidobacteraceae bacterium]